MRKMKRYFTLCLALVLALSLMIPIASADGVVEWGGTYSSPDNNTVVNYPLPTNTSVEMAWSAKVGNSTIAIVGDYIYTCSASQGCKGVVPGTLSKVEKDSGEIVKQVSTGLIDEYQYSHITYGGDLIYVSVPSAIAAYDPKDLDRKWIYNRTDKSSAYAAVQYVNGFVVSNGVVINSTGGKERTLEGSYNWANGAVVDGFYYVASGNMIRAFNTTTWEQTHFLRTNVSNGSGAGVMHYNGRLYWGDQVAGKFYSVALNGDGTFDTGSLIIKDTGGIMANTTPVAYGRRVYLAGNTTTLSNFAGTASVLAFNAQNLELDRKVNLPQGSDGSKIQSTPILHPVSSGGAETASFGEIALAGIADTNTTTAYIYVQDYQSPGKVYLITDNGSQTSGEPIVLITPTAQCANFAYEQLACDADGAIYCNTNSGYLMKWQSIRAGKPEITTNLSTVEVTYAQGAATAELKVEASVTDGGRLKYQWYKKVGDKGYFEEISGATEPVYRPSAADIGTFFYKCTVTNARGTDTNSIDSNIAKITVIGIQKGDVNGDGTIDKNDITTLVQYLAEYDVTIVPSAGDINEDGKVDLVDLIRLRRYLGWGWSLK